MDDAPSQSPYAHARATIIAVLVFALIGSLLGATLGVWQGAVSGGELWLIGSCLVFSAVLLVVVLFRPFDRIGWIAPVAGSYFLFYLCAGGVMALASDVNTDNLAVYLFWFFPLYAFNKFVNVDRSQWLFSGAILLAPIAMVAVILASGGAPVEDRPILVVYCLAYASFALILRLFAQYREAFIGERERSQAIEAADREVRASEERFRIIARATADTLWDWDLVEQKTWWSEGLRTLYGYEPQGFEPGQDAWTSRIHPDDRARVVDSIDRCTQGVADSWQAEYRFARADGTYAIVADRGFVIRDAGGRAVRMVGGMTDVSDTRLLEDKLRQSQRLEAIGQLTGGIAHDFNNLLTVILGNTEMLAEGLSHDADLAALAETAAIAAERGAELTKRLLAFARQQPLEPRALDLNDIIAGMHGMLRRTLGENIDIEFARKDLPPVFVDAGQLENAVLNLAINARDAMPDGGRLTIETASVDLDEDYARANEEVVPGPYVMVAVSDTGTGMPAEVVARAFEPFFTTKGLGAGSGLGLSMVFGYVKQSNGHVRIYSEPGHGTTVRLYLPRATGAREAGSRQAIAGPVAGGTESILLVEDDPMVQRFVEAQLKALGYRVRCVGNGVDALAALEGGEAFDLLFTDVVMPGGINGALLADRAAKLRPGLPVLFTSGYTENSVVHHGRLDRGVHLLNKPYSRAALAAKLREVLDEAAPASRPAGDGN